MTAKAPDEGPMPAAVCTVLATLRSGGSTSCGSLAAVGLADGAACGRRLAAACREGLRTPGSGDLAVGIHGRAGVAVGFGRLGALLGDPAGFLGGLAGFLGGGAALLVADGFGEGAFLVEVGVGDGVAIGVVDGVGDAVSVGVSDGAGDGSVLGAVLGLTDADGAVDEADGEGLSSGDALACPTEIARAAAPAVTVPRTTRTAVRAASNMGPPGLG
jgi:hypothetical protein